MATNSITYENHLDSTTARWFAVYTRYKREKIVRQELERKGIEVYLPINKVVRKWQRKVKTVELPLISCYIFVKIKKSEYIRVLETENVVSFVRFSKNLISIPEQEVDIMRQITGEFQNLEVDTSQLNQGDEVEIIGGTLTGMKGRLMEKDNRKRFVVSLDSLGYTFRMEVDGKLLKKISSIRGFQ